FAGAGWNVINVLWISDCDKLLQDPRVGKKLDQRLSELNDGQFNKIKAHGGAYFLRVFFRCYEDLEEIAKDIKYDYIQS
ncbi:hypothetical protein, partial [Francisella tularensis]|uniref:hypothetical protein n=1 Tax=Francisella tularensis TaxID=263 RepID=UPI002381AB44